MKERLSLQERQEREYAKVKRARRIGINAVIAILALAAIGAGTGYLTEGLKAAAAQSQYTENKTEIVESATHDINFAVVQAAGSPSTSWIYLPDTGIDYPMVQGEDNDTYLEMDAYGNPSKAGAIFINYANDRNMNDAKTVIFGHNMNDGSMFTPLHEFKDEEYGNTHTDAYIYLADGTCKHYKLRYYIFTEPLDEAVYLTSATETAAEAAYNLKEDADIIYGEWTGGNLICLSTCTFHNYRTVVVYEYIDDNRPIVGLTERMKESLSDDQVE